MGWEGFQRASEDVFLNEAVFIIRFVRMRKMAHVKTLDTWSNTLRILANVGNIASHLSPLKYIRQIKTKYIIIIIIIIITTLFIVGFKFTSVMLKLYNKIIVT